MSAIRDLAANCEAKLHGFRRTADGVVVSFVLHPAEVPQALALDPLGSRYMLAFVAIGDDEQPAAPRSTVPAAPSDRSVKAKEKYANATERQQAVIRSAQYPRHAWFREWAQCETEAAAAHFIRDRCNAQSRSEIETNAAAYRAFIAMETDYKMWAGLLPERR